MYDAAKILNSMLPKLMNNSIRMSTKWVILDSLLTISADPMQCPVEQYKLPWVLHLADL
jgi:hypothetical protein